MKQPLMIPFCLTTMALLTLPAYAQGEKPKKTDDETPKVEQKHKDDEHTTNDKAVVAIDAFIAGDGKPAANDSWKLRLKKPPQLEFDKKANYFWHIQTNKGEITVQLLPDVAPMHVSSTMFLARTGFYDGLTFHRVIQGFMAQGGCPLGAGSGGPGYTYDGECDEKVKHDKPGLLSMANTGQPTSDGSQFFLTFVPTKHLNMKHTIFGEVTDGMDVVRTLEKCGSRSGKTSEPLSMEKTWIAVQPKGKSKGKDAAPKKDEKKSDEKKSDEKKK